MIGSELYRAIVESAPGFLCVHDAGGKLVFVNESAARALGISPGDALGLGIADVVHESMRPLVPRYLARMRRLDVAEAVVKMHGRNGAAPTWAFRCIR
ncbi:MAG TPA: PAS domain-containing protein, partial [Thermoanaerobaculia bacterium]|nr:PAS domain-containing protein [Thermoanaerobaculia bacterium]